MFPPPQLLRPSQLLLISDSLLAPADFLLYHLLFESIRPNPLRPCFYLSASHDLRRLIAVGTKSGSNVARSIEEGTLVLKDLPKSASSSESLQDVYARLASQLASLEDRSQPALIIVDDLATLSWLGQTVLELTHFVRALLTLCRKHKATLIIRHHSVTQGDSDDMLRHFIQSCTYHVEFRQLSSGRSGSVSGEIALHGGPTLFEPDVKLRTRRDALHYHLTDTGASYFERGTGSNVL